MTELEIRMRGVLRELRARVDSAKAMARNPQFANDAAVYASFGIAYAAAADELEKALNDGP